MKTNSGVHFGTPTFPNAGTKKISRQGSVDCCRGKCGKGIVVFRNLGLLCTVEGIYLSLGGCQGEEKESKEGEGKIEIQETERGKETRKKGDKELLTVQGAKQDPGSIWGGLWEGLDIGGMK